MKLYLLVFAFLFSNALSAQKLPSNPNPTKVNLPAALPLRDVVGAVKDTANLGIAAITVRLTSDKDTLSVRSNSDGSFIFKNVKSASYILSINALSYAPFIAKFRQNDALSTIVMEPIILTTERKMLNEVVINGTPSISYKTDTVEYRAKDYIVRENSTVDELLKKMEGVEIGNDGSLLHQGVAVARAKINGKIYMGGDVATAIQNLPADIVDKIQIVDDYGDQADRTGIKDGDPDKILNIVTRADKSVGNTANFSTGAGNENRYEGSLFATRISGTQTMGINSRFANTVNGVASNEIGNFGQGGRPNTIANPILNSNANAGGSGGITTNGNNSFSFRDQLSKKVRLNTNYRYNFNDNNVIRSSVSQIFSTRGTIFSSNESVSDNNTKTHNFSAELEIELNKKNFLKITPSFAVTSSLNESEGVVLQSGLIRQDQKSLNTTSNNRPNFGGIVFYQHTFAKPRRNFSAQINLNTASQDLDQERNANIIYYQNTTNLVVRDSLIHRLVARDNLTKNYRSSLTFVEPLNDNTQLELNFQLLYNAYDNSAVTSNINKAGIAKVVDSLSNIYEYSFTQSRIALNYRYGMSRKAKFKFSFGVTAVPGVLKGSRLGLNTIANRKSFNVIPISRLQYVWSKQHSLQFNYSGNAIEPSFDQIQPFVDVSNPQNFIVGNPNLKVTFNHTLNSTYNNYLSKSKINYSINTSAVFVENAVTRNLIQVRDAYNSLRNETRFVNISGVYRINGNYSISKQFSNRKYNLSLSGFIAHNNGVSMSNNIENVTTTWSFNERFGPRFNPTTWLEVNPFVSYTFIKSDNTLPTSLDNRTNNLAINLDGKFIIRKTLIFGYTAAKNYVSGINANVTNNPLVINTFIQKEFWKRRASLAFQAFDLLNQNNFINRNITDFGITDTKSNALSRYFMLRFNMRLQKWTGVKPKNGKPMMRMSDGNFVPEF